VEAAEESGLGAWESSAARTGELVTVTAELVRGLAGVAWAWTTEEFADAVFEAGWELAEVVGHRRSYRLGDWVLCSYAEGDDVQIATVAVAVAWPDKLLDDYFLRWEEVTGDARALLGEPRFSDGIGKPGFPDEFDALWASVWTLPTGRLMVLQTHPDKELPYCIEVACAPERSLADTAVEAFAE
jgi:hypothetical protein